jgi:hypothetical protein
MARWATGTGWHFGGLGPGEVIELTGCTSQLNWQDGFLFDNSSGVGGLATYTLTGCRSWRDGQAGGTTYAGFRASGSLSRVIGTGCVAVPNAQGPAYGAAQVAKSYGMCFTGAYLNSLTAATYDDGTNTHALLNQSPVPF